MILSPSVYSMHFDHFKEEMDALNECVEWIHFDVMDGHFVPNLTFGPGILQTIRRNSDRFLDVHLMVSDPDHYSEVFANAGADSIVFHYEAYNDIDKCVALIDKIHQMYLKAGISIKPGTPVETIYPLLDKIDIFLMMSVEPGFGGQAYIESSTEKIRAMRAALTEKGYPDMDLEVDGGVKSTNLKTVLDAGANVIVAGSAVFGKDISKRAIE